MKSKILIIDDDENLLKLAETGLEEEDFEVLTAKDGLQGLRSAFNNHPDLIVLDIRIPEMDGLEVCQRLQELTDTPIIILSALSATTDVVKGLSLGADDYMTKPFSMAELVARIRTCLRRSESSRTQSPLIFMSGSLMIDMARHKVTVRGNLVNLTPTEFHLLSYLARHRGQVVPHSTLLTEVWGPEYRDQIEYLHLYIRYLRQKIERDPSNPELIKIERSVGYYLEED